MKLIYYLEKVAVKKSKITGENSQKFIDKYSEEWLIRNIEINKYDEFKDKYYKEFNVMNSYNSKEFIQIYYKIIIANKFISE